MFFLNCDKRLDLQGVPKVRSSNFMRYKLLIQTLFLLEISRKCLLLYQVHVFRIKKFSVTGAPPSLFYHIL